MVAMATASATATATAPAAQAARLRLAERAAAARRKATDGSRIRGPWPIRESRSSSNPEPARSAPITRSAASSAATGRSPHAGSRLNKTTATAVASRRPRVRHRAERSSLRGTAARSPCRGGVAATSSNGRTEAARAVATASATPRRANPGSNRISEAGIPRTTDATVNLTLANATRAPRNPTSTPRAPPTSPMAVASASTTEATRDRDAPIERKKRDHETPLNHGGGEGGRHQDAPHQHRNSRQSDQIETQRRQHLLGEAPALGRLRHTHIRRQQFRRTSLQQIQIGVATGHELDAVEPAHPPQQLLRGCHVHHDDPLPHRRELSTVKDPGDLDRAGTSVG